MEPFSIAAGAAAVGLAWFLKLAGGKAVTAALAWLKAKWAARGAVKGVAGALAELQALVDTLRADVEALKAKAEPPAAAPPPAFLKPQGTV